MSSETKPAGPPSLRYSYFAAVMLAVIYTFNFLDRQFLSVLAQPVKADLHLNDTELGALTGLAFALFYTVFGIPVAALSDKYNRVRIIAVACALWSVFSAACGMAANFTTLALARMGVGIGEAGGSPPSYSVVSDYFPPEKRGVGLAIYSLGVPFGTMFGAMSGGWIAAHYGWRAAFFAVGSCGVVLVPLLLLTVREPKRGQFDAVAPEPASQAHPAAGLGMFNTIGLFIRTPKLLATALATGLTSFVGYGLLNWMPSFLIREKGMTLGQIALYYSVSLGLTMAIGTWASGFLVDKIGARRPVFYALVPGIATLLAVPFFIGVLLAPSWPSALLFLLGPSILNIAYLAPALAVIQNAVRSERRGTAGAFLLFILNLVGLGGGPLFVGFMSDRFKAAGVAHALTGALMSLTPFFVLAFLCQCAAGYFISRDDRQNL
jgi:MFS family permease